MQAYVAPYAQTHDGQTGAFLYDSSTPVKGDEPLRFVLNPVSPVFFNVGDLFEWCRENGWTPAEDNLLCDYVHA